MVECPGASRKELAERLGRTPDSLRDLLKKLRNLGLVETLVRGRYYPVEDWEEVLDRERWRSGEKKSVQLMRERHERQREGYRLALEERKRRQRRDAGDQAPGEELVECVGEVLEMARAILNPTGVVYDPPPPPPAPPGRDPLVHTDTAKARAYLPARQRWAAACAAHKGRRP